MAFLLCCKNLNSLTCKYLVKSMIAKMAHTITIYLPTGQFPSETEKVNVIGNENCDLLIQS